MERPTTFEVATLLIAKETGKGKDEAMKVASGQYPDLFVEYSNRIKSGGKDHFEALSPKGFGSEKPFEQIVAETFRRVGGTKKDAVMSAMKEAPAAYQKYLLRLQNGEKVKFDLTR
jgi:hypothetical protein